MMTRKYFMFLWYSCRRALAAVTAVIIMTVALSSCYRIDMQYAPSVEPPPPVGSSVSPSPTAEPEVIRFADLLGQVLSEVSLNSDTLTCAPLDVMFRPVPEKDTETSNYTYVKMRLSKPDATEPDVTISGEAIRNAVTGDASFVAYNQSGTEPAEQAGVWFTGNTMLIKKSYEPKPILQLLMTPEVSRSMGALPAFNRLMRVLGDAGAVKLTQETWDDAVNIVLNAVIDNGRALDLASENRSETFGGVKVATISETLKLGGERGLAVARGLTALLAKEAEFKALFNTQYLLDEAQYGVTGYDGAIRDIDALTGIDRNAALTTIELIETDRPVGFRMSVEAGGKTMALNLISYQRGPTSHNELLFGGFDGSRVILSRVVTSDGAGTFSSQFTYDALSPGAQPQENLTVISSGATSAGALTVTAQLSLTRASSVAAGAVIIGGTLNYTQQEDGGDIQGSGAGTLNISDGGKSHSYIFDLSLIQTNETVPVTPPVFDASAGSSTATQDGLYRALGAFDGRAFVLAPPTLRFQAIFSILFI